MNFQISTFIVNSFKLVCQNETTINMINSNVLCNLIKFHSFLFLIRYLPSNICVAERCKVKVINYLGKVLLK